MQEIKKISISKLKLWSENPRDPIKNQEKYSDFEIVKKALEDKDKKWNLKNFIKKMGENYDNSEIPTVVKIGNEWVVYDGNRRLTIIKYSQNPNWWNQINVNREKLKIHDNFKNLVEIYCNVCDEETALNNIERKHVNNGSWRALERDYFEYIHRKKPASDFLVIEKATGIISKNKKMNQDFVKKETLNRVNLNKIGFNIKNGKLYSVYEPEEIKKILANIVYLIEEKIITTRKNRRKLLEPLKEKFPKLKINQFDKNKEKIVKKLKVTKKETPRTKEKPKEIFGGKLILVKGIVNDIYKDIRDLYTYYNKNKKLKKLSKTFPNIIRMALRLLVEAAAGTQKTEEYIDKSRYKKAMDSFDGDTKAEISAKIDNAKRLNKLLQMGAHNYSVSASIEDTLIMSKIIGRMLEQSHSK